MKEGSRKKKGQIRGETAGKSRQKTARKMGKITQVRPRKVTYREWEEWKCS